MNIVTAENGIIQLLSRTLQLTENTNLFRGTMPVGVYCGFSAEIISGTPATADSVNKFSASVTGSDFDRTTLWNRFSTLFQALKNGENHEGFLWVKLADEVEFSQTSDRGQLLFTGKAMIDFSFL